MSKIAKKAAAIALAVAVFASGAAAVFTGCSNGSESTGTVNKDTAVYSNGGTVVQYGDYVYFINGIPDYTDESGATNITGSVVKGGIYRARINWDRPMNIESEEQTIVGDGEEALLTPDEYELTRARATTLYDVLDFDYKLNDYIELHEYTIGNESGTEPATYVDENGVTRQNFVPTNGASSEFAVAVEPVVSKKVGTSGYDGGMWIYDGVIYFASPSNERATDGSVEYTRPTFWAYDIERGSLSELYSATENSASVPYAFYKIGDYVYLTTFENYYANSDDEEDNILTGYIVVNRISGTGVVSKYELVEDVANVYFPTEETYDPDDESPAGLEEYIYFTRENTKDDVNPNGYTLEMISPAAEPGADGSRLSIDSSASGTIGLTGSAGGYLYYTKTASDGHTRLLINSLYAQLNKFDPDYNEETCDAPAMTNTNSVLCSDTSEYTTILPIPQDSNDMNAPCFIGGNSDGIFRVWANGITQVYSGTITLVGYHEGRVYCTLDSSAVDDEDEDTSDSEDTEEEEGTTAFISASAYEDYSHQTAAILNMGVAPTTTPFSIDFVSLGFSKDGNGAEVDTTETYVSYFGTYGGTMSNYMYLNKVSGIWDRASNVNIQLGDVVYSEAPAITCYDRDCLNFLHDHSSWDDYTEDEEETGDESVSL